ncbi:MAG: hypothetical protein PHV51_05570 [Methanosarcinaceae archaeon]|nr:hypothetical protein [Methanosarcinaceae archaeon]MDD4497604.1 hypothetical protein [Methanosarcinaceae archaeon]
MASPFRYDYSSENGFFHFSGSSGVIYFKYNFVNKGLPVQYSSIYRQTPAKVPSEEKTGALE